MHITRPGIDGAKGLMCVADAVPGDVDLGHYGVRLPEQLHVPVVDGAVAGQAALVRVLLVERGIRSRVRPLSSASSLKASVTKGVRTFL